ncbi:carboxylate--amine ligase, partial [Rhodopila globiformis]
MTAGKALVLGDDTRSFLATVRSLGRQGIAVHAAPDNFRSPALASRYITAVHELPPWMGDGADWLRAMETLLAAERFDLVIPCNETALLPLQRHRYRLAPLARLAIPDDHAIAALFDKHATRALAQQVGVPVAAGRLARPDDTAGSVAAEFGLPLVVKPRRSYALETLASRGKAQVVRDAAELARVLREVDPAETLLEQVFPGQGLGVSLLASQGRVLQAFEHHRVRELAGASYYRVSAPLTPALLRGCDAIVAALRYTGVAMFEFKCNAQGGWILLEVNARPWGSLPLPVALGVDFPYRWYRLLVAGEATPAVNYPVGIYGRNLLPDLTASRKEAAALRLGRMAKARFMAGRGLELLRGVTGRERHDVLVRDDPGPGLAELRALGGDVWQRLARALPH